MSLIWLCQHVELTFMVIIFSQIGPSVYCHLLLWQLVLAFALLYIWASTAAVNYTVCSCSCHRHMLIWLFGLSVHTTQSRYCFTLNIVSCWFGFVAERYRVDLPVDVYLLLKTRLVMWVTSLNVTAEVNRVFACAKSNIRFNPIIRCWPC